MTIWNMAQNKITSAKRGTLRFHEKKIHWENRGEAIDYLHIMIPFDLTRGDYKFEIQVRVQTGQVPLLILGQPMVGGESEKECRCDRPL